MRKLPSVCTREMSVINCLTKATYLFHFTQLAPQLVERSEVNAAVFPVPNLQVERMGSISSASGLRRMLVARGLPLVRT